MLNTLAQEVAGKSASENRKLLIVTVEVREDDQSRKRTYKVPEALLELVLLDHGTYNLSLRLNQQ